MPFYERGDVRIYYEEQGPLDFRCCLPRGAA